MSYWYGYRIVELDGSNPGAKCLEGPFPSYDEAKAHKQRARARDLEQTAVYRADSKIEAESKLHLEQFSRL